MRSGHVVIDGDNRLISIDRGFARIMQAEVPALIGRQVLDITAPADRAECCQAINRLRATRTPFEICKRFVREDGSLFWVTNSVSMVGDGGNGEMIVATILPFISSDEARAPALLLDYARLLVNVRADRTEIFDPAIFSNKGWDVMLAAYVAEAEGRAITVAALAQRLDISPARAERWISALARSGVIEIETRHIDAYAPKSFRLTSPAHMRLEGHLARAADHARSMMRPYQTMDETVQ